MESLSASELRVLISHKAELLSDIDYEDDDYVVEIVGRMAEFGDALSVILDAEEAELNPLV
mgnify:FL=1